MGSKTQQSSSTTTPNSAALGAYQNILGQAQSVAATPYQQYGGELVAGVNGEQNAGIGAINNASGVANPYIGAATTAANAGAQAINPTAVDGAAISQYESPYQSQVVNSTMAQIANTDAQQAQQQTGSAITAGAFGGDRAGVAQAALAGQQAIANNSTLASLNNQNYSQALNEANTQQQTSLSAAQNNAARQGQAAFTLGSLGQEAQSTALTGANAQLTAGGLQQGTQQAQDTANYGQFENQQAYPFQTLGWLSNIATGVGSQMGTTTNGTTQGPSTLASILGGVGALGAAFIPKQAGGRVTLGDAFASGGGVSAMPYADATGYVPTSSMSAMHSGMSSPRMAQPAQSSQAGVSGINSGLSAIGSAVSRTGLGDSIQDGLQDAFDGLARGGGVRGFDGGGVVSPYGGLDLSAFEQPMSLPVEATPLPDASSAQPTPANVPLPPVRPSDLGSVASAPTTPTTPDAPDAPAPSNGLAAIQNIAPQAADDGTAPGLSNNRRNNPGNLIDGDYAKSLPGYAGSDGRFAVFNTPAAGQSAMDANLASYGRQGIDTPLAIASKWAPRSDGNDPTNYASFVAGKLGIGLNDHIDMSDPGVRARLGVAMSQMENGARGSSGGSLPQGVLGYAGASAGQSGQGQGGLGGISPAPYTQSSPANLSSLAAPDKGVWFDDNGIHASDDARMALISAGLGMMASKSHFLGNAIGDGGQAGMQTYMQQRQLDRQNAIAAADVGYKNADTAYKSGTLALDQQRENFNEGVTNRKVNGALAVSNYLNGPGGAHQGLAGVAPAATPPAGIGTLGSIGAGAPPAPLPVQGQSVKAGSNALMAGAAASAAAVKASTSGNAAPAAAPGALQPAAAVNNPRLVPSSDPSYLDQQADRFQTAGQQMLAYDPDQARSLMEASGRFRQTADAIRQRGYATAADGSTVLLPGFAASKEQIAASEESGRVGVQNQNQLQEVQPTPGGPKMLVRKSDALASPNGVVAEQPGFYTKKQDAMAANETDMASAFQERQVARERLGAMANILQTFKTGANSEAFGDAVAQARSFGIPISNTDVANPAALQQFTKNAAANVFGDMKAQGNRQFVSEQQGLMKANANAELQPEANAAILSQQIGKIDYLDKHYSDYENWKSQNPNATDAAPFEIAWAKQNPMSQFVSAAGKGIAPAGVARPPVAQLVDGQAYMTRHGKAYWNAKAQQFTMGAP